ncbi:MAG: hypothetical protein LBH62_02090 [Nitrososphaerota archaeon]|jgi:hypothetical protein|nr:hypothetical protein [Nitrososphaerota archaeon]
MVYDNVTGFSLLSSGDGFGAGLLAGDVVGSGVLGEGLGVELPPTVITKQAFYKL